MSSVYELGRTILTVETSILVTAPGGLPYVGEDESVALMAGNKSSASPVDEKMEE